jgi:F-type H+-transporting ATPase subunit epsilon
MAELNLEIITPSKVVFNGEVKSVTIPGTDGNFQVLKNHAPLISTFEIGLVKAELPDNSINYFATAGGTAEVLNNKVLVLADSLERIEDIDVERARLARERAEKLIAQPTDTTDVERARKALARAANRLVLVEKYMRGLK